MSSVGTLKRINRLLKGFKEDRGGNFAITFALSAIPLVLAVGVSVDFARVYNTQSKMQSDLDAGLLAAAQHIDNLNEEKLEERVKEWFAAQTDLNASKYSIKDVKVSKKDGSISASVTASIPTTFMSLANISEMPLAAFSSVAGPATAFLDVYIVLDKSPSMLLAAHPEDQKVLGRDPNIGCQFACHDNRDKVYDRHGRKLANNYYDYIKGRYRTELRADVANTAAKEVVELIAKADQGKSHIQIGLYTLGAGVNEILAPDRSSFNKVRKYLNSDALTSKTSDTATHFGQSFSDLEKFIGSAGDGSNRSKPQKLVLLLTDGVESERGWVVNGIDWRTTGWEDPDHDGTYTPTQRQEDWKKVGPMNPGICDDIKDKKVKIGVLYTEYLKIPTDWGFDATLDEPMSTSKWGGTLRKDISPKTTRTDYIRYALEDCASSSDLFLSASDPDDIEEGLSDLFNRYLSTVRLTQ